MDCLSVGNVIKSNRIANNMTQKDLAEKINVSDKAVSKWERGKCYPDISLFEKLSQELNVPIDSFMGSDNRSKEKKTKLVWQILFVSLILLGVAGCLFFMTSNIRFQVLRWIQVLAVAGYLSLICFVGLKGRRNTCSKD